MIQITPHMRLFIATSPADFRGGIDCIAGIVKYKLLKDPMDGALFVFHNRKRTSIKILIYDGSGYWLMQKRWSQGKIHWWNNIVDQCHPITAEELLGLIWGGDARDFRSREKWKKVA
ncbi:MAG: IS66 family insertion sequence element accessory protein TnpB [Oligoflexia bacterium]|nr:IS66 family insertion sequence element accessory protein TnpB [Oligoflexia bacterium]